MILPFVFVTICNALPQITSVNSIVFFQPSCRRARSRRSGLGGVASTQGGDVMPKEVTGGGTAAPCVGGSVSAVGGGRGGSDGQGMTKKSFHDDRRHHSLPKLTRPSSVTEELK